MHIICKFCGEKMPVYVPSWLIQPVDKIQSSPDNPISLGQLHSVNIDSNTPFYIKPAPAIYGCRKCGFETNYLENEIIS